MYARVISHSVTPIQHISAPLQQEPVNHTLFLSVISTYMAHTLKYIEAIYVLMTLRNSVWFTGSCCNMLYNRGTATCTATGILSVCSAITIGDSPVRLGQVGGGIPQGIGTPLMGHGK